MDDLKSHLEATYPASRSAKLSVSEIASATTSYVTQLEQQGVAQKTAIDLGDKYAASLKAGGSAATEQAQTILTAFGGAKSGSTFLTLYEELSRLQSKYKDFGTSAQAAAKFQQAWVVQQQTAKQKLDDLKASWDVFEVKIGNAILPALKNVLDVLSKHPGILKAAAGAVALFAAAWTVSKFAGIARALIGIATAVTSIGTASAIAAPEVVALGAAEDAAAAGGVAEGLGAAGKSAAYAKLFAGTDAAAGAGGAGLLGVGAGGLLAGGAAAGATLGGASFLLDKYLGDDFGKKSGPGTPQVFKALNIESLFPKSLQGSINAVAQKYGDQAAANFEIALVRNGGNVQKAWASILKSVPNASKDFGAATTSVESWWKAAADQSKISVFQNSLKNAGALLDSNTNSLLGNTAGAVSNRNGLKTLTDQAISAANGYQRMTGQQGDATKALELSIPQILNQAQATGLNRQQAADFLNTVIHIPGFHVTTLGLDGTAAAEAQVAAFLQTLAAIPKQISVPVTAFITNPSVANQLAGSALGYNSTPLPKHATGGIAKGWSIIGDQGAELVHVGSPSAVLPHRQTMDALGGSTVINVNMSVQALDPKSVSPSQRAAWARETAIEIKKALGNGLRLN